jgi:transcriptional regulator with XRE-family HTH domain
VPRRRDVEEWQESGPVAERLRSILATKGLTLYRISQESARLYGRSSPYFVPHNLYYDLRSEGFSPSIHQIVAISRISGYRLRDWLRVFAFDLEEITRLQVQLPAKRTIVLDTSLTDHNEWVVWFCNRELREPISSPTPLSRLLEFRLSERIHAMPKPSQHFFYAKIGLEDALAFPDLVPGGIVRIDPKIRPERSFQKSVPISDSIFLIEHGKGFCCCRLRFLANGSIVPFANGLPYAQVELRTPEQLKVWGAVDVEFRPLLCANEPRVPRDLAHRWKPQSLPERQSFGQLLKATRRRLHISTREGARMSRMVADRLNDDRYACSSSSMSDYELRGAPPRDFHKIITLCSIYGLHFRSVMKAAGIDIADSGTESMSDRYLLRPEPSWGIRRVDESHLTNGFLEHLLSDCQNEIPFFLRDLQGYFSSSTHHSLDDFFWIGGDREPLHPCLANGLVIVVNRRRKTPSYVVWKPVWEQPIFVVLLREGQYLAACCGIEDDRLVIHPVGQDFHPASEYRYHRDAEVVGQIAAIARRFS